VLRDGISFISYDNTENHSSGNADEPVTQQIKRELRKIMWQYVSLCRDRDGLLEARHKVRSLHQQLLRYNRYQYGKESLETCNMLQVAELVIAAALERRESRGSHWRLDYQFLDENLAKRHFAFRPLNIDTNGLLESQEEVITYA